MEETALDLLRQGRKSQIWTKYCGFLDLTLDEFMKIQERLLLEQISLLGKTEIGRHLLREEVPNSIAEFRQNVPISSYDDYESLLDPDVCNYPNVYLWAHTSGRSGRFKWVPYTEQAYYRLGERVLAGVILASAREKGEFRLKEHDVLVTNTPPRPYISGVSLRALAEQFNFHFIPSLEETEDIDFQARIERGFQEGMETGIDVLGSMSVVLVKMGERFADGARSTKLSRQMLKPRVLFRLLRAFARSKLENRNVLPKDIWSIKALPTGGADTSLYKDKIEYYWGAEPYEQYGCTEEGAIATQAWNKKYMTFFPDAAFYEFIPEEEWYKWRLDSSYRPQTVLMNEVVPSKKYELVLTNFYGKPLLRYRTYDLIEFPLLQDTEVGIRLPQMAFAGRTNDLIDLAGFTGLIDEKMVWRAIANTGITYKEWAIRKEASGGEPILRLYMEPDTQTDQETVRNKVHEALKDINSFYADYEAMIAKPALEVTLLQPGTFQAYQLEKQKEGADLAHLKPPRMNPTDEVIETLMKLDGDRRS
jgi:hypothetical protein